MSDRPLTEDDVHGELFPGRMWLTQEESLAVPVITGNLTSTRFEIAVKVGKRIPSGEEGDDPVYATVVLAARDFVAQRIIVAANAPRLPVPIDDVAHIEDIAAGLAAYLGDTVRDYDSISYQDAVRALELYREYERTSSPSDTGSEGRRNFITENLRSPRQTDPSGHSGGRTARFLRGARSREDGNQQR